MTHPREEAARLAKALKLVGRLRRDGVTGDLAAAAPESWWQLVADAAGTRIPSATTRAMVVRLLRERENDVCPKCGCACAAVAFKGFEGAVCDGKGAA